MGHLVAVMGEPVLQSALQSQPCHKKTSILDSVRVYTQWSHDLRDIKRPIHADVCQKAERPAGNSEGNSRVRNAPMRAPYTQRFAHGSGQNWHFVSLACQENFKEWRESDGPRVEAKPGGSINHTQRFALRLRKPAGLPSIILSVYGHP
jgi:hypothetical protein